MTCKKIRHRRIEGEGRILEDLEGTEVVKDV